MFSTDIRGHPSAATLSLKLPNTMSAFLRERQAAKTSASIAKLRIQKNVDTFKRIADVRSLTLIPTRGNSSNDIMEQQNEVANRRAGAEQVTASKVSTMLFSAFHNMNSFEWFIPAVSISYALILSNRTRVNADGIGNMYSKLCNMPYATKVFNAINNATVANNSIAILELYQNYPDSINICKVYLFARHLALSKHNMDAAAFNVTREIDSSSRRRSRNAGGGIDNKYKVGKYFRVAKMIQDKLANLTKQSPHTHLKRISGSVSRHHTIPSIFEQTVDQALRASDLAEQKIKDTNLEGYIANKYVISKLRKVWSDYYKHLSHEYLKLSIIDTEMLVPNASSSLKNLMNKKWHSKCNSYIYASVAIECMVCVGRSLAYKFYFIGFKAKEHADITTYEMAKSMYSDWLGEYGSTEFQYPDLKGMNVNACASKLHQSKSAIGSELTKTTNYLHSKLGVLGYTDQTIKTIIKEAYLNSKSKIVQTINDMVMRDTKFISLKHVKITKVPKDTAKVHKMTDKSTKIATASLFCGPTYKRKPKNRERSTILTSLGYIESVTISTDMKVCKVCTELKSHIKRLQTNEDPVMTSLCKHILDLKYVGLDCADTETIEDFSTSYKSVFDILMSAHKLIPVSNSSILV